MDFGVLPARPGGPTNLQKDYEYHSNEDAYTPKMSWNSVSDADFYEIELTINYDMDNPPFPSPTIFTTEQTEYISAASFNIWVDTYFQGSDDYIYRVRSVKNSSIGPLVRSDFSLPIEYSREQN